MVDYSKGQIYKVCDDAFTACYIGSTVTPLCKRFQSHKKHYTRYKDGKCRYTTIFDMFDIFGVSNCKIYWLEDFPCNSKKELQAREGHYIKNNECVNKRIEGRTWKEYYADKKEQLLQYKKDRRKNNPELMREQYERRYEKTKAQQAMPFECCCGVQIRVDNVRRHLKSNKHQQYLQSQTNPQE